MDGSFDAYQVVRDGEGFQGRVVKLPFSALPPGDVLIKVHYSSLNYKDALSATGNPGVTRKYPTSPVSMRRASSPSPRWSRLDPAMRSS